MLLLYIILLLFLRLLFMLPFPMITTATIAVTIVPTASFPITAVTITYY